jgi:predicted secreted protein
MTDAEPFRLSVDDATVEGRAVSLSADAVSAEALAGAIADVESSSGNRLDVDCPEPGPLYEFVGRLEPNRPFDRRGALAALARSRGHEPPQAAEMADLTERLADADGSTVDLAEARKRAATVAAEEARLREEVATARGRLQTLRELGRPHEEAEETFRERVRRLTEVETERAAARERLRQLERDARRDRDARERRFALADRLANRRREARAWLADQVYDSFAAATAALADETGVSADAGSDPGDYEGDPLVAAAAVARVGDVSAPLVVSTSLFGDAERTATLLDATVVRLTR